MANDVEGAPELDSPLGPPPVFVSTSHDLSAAAEALAAGTGPIGVDTERASGYRYSQRAYLVQVFRRGSGTFLLDPPSIGDVSELGRAIGSAEWVLHAASQDLPSLREISLVPQSLFDTELSARLLGYERVGLGSVVEQLMHVHLRKAYSAVDWSTRPLPTEWLTYAALDVQLLPDLRDIMLEQLRESNKLTLAQQEFDAVLHAPAKPTPAEPWRKLSGIHSLRKPQQLAMARALWLARDELARTLDVAPGRLVPDSSLIAAVQANPSSRADLAELGSFSGRATRSHLDIWWKALAHGRSDTQPPARATPGETLPPPKAWADRNPEAHQRLTHARAAVALVAERLDMPVENVLSPRLLRWLSWHAGELAPLLDAEIDETALADAVAESLRQGGARPWQVDATAQVIAAAFVESRLPESNGDSQNS